MDYTTGMKYYWFDATRKRVPALKAQKHERKGHEGKSN
jgi:hypothetical protein